MGRFDYRLGIRAFSLAALALAAACGGPEPEKAKPPHPSGLGELFRSVRSGEFRLDPNSSQPPHVILISLDTLRADHLGTYGYHRDTSPFLDELSEHGVLFERVISQSPKTAPSHMSLMTGVYPRFHGAHLSYEENNVVTFHKPNEALGRLAEWFSDAGYRTAAWTGGGQVAAEAGFGRGFESYRENFGDIDDEKFAEVWTWFRERASDPCFLFLHTYQIHDPYVPPRPYDRLYDPDYGGWIVGDAEEMARRAGYDYFARYKIFWGIEFGGPIDATKFSPRDVEHLRALYDGGIRYTDEMLARFFQVLASDGLLQNAVVAVVSDHGEEFLEHGGFLHKKLFIETMHVPLLLFGPGRVSPGRRVAAQVELMDLTPTLLGLAGLEGRDQIMSRSLVHYLDGGESADRPAFSEEPWINSEAHTALRADGWTLYAHGAEGTLLYDVAADPAEQRDLAPGDEARARLLAKRQQELLAERSEGWQPADAEASVDPVSDELVEKLRALGYVD